MSSMHRLPDFIKPMLAKPSAPFDSEEHLFEIKWDGTRIVAYVDADGYRLVNRRKNVTTERYPEFEFLASLPAGTVLDGEIVVLDDEGKSVFDALQTREQARSQLKFRTLSRATPATYIVFDQLYRSGTSLMDQPLADRRRWLKEIVTGCNDPHLVMSEGILGAGIAFFQSAVERDLEGIIAKRLSSRYLPGKRTDAWLKIKKQSVMPCAIIGFIPKRDDFESLILAAEDKGELRCVGKVGTGFDSRTRKVLNKLLRSHVATRPLVPCRDRGQWVRAGLYCSVRYLERTKNGDLRAPVFDGLITDVDSDFE